MKTPNCNKNMPRISDELNGNYLDTDSFTDADLEDQADVSIIEIPRTYGSPEAYLADHGLNLPNKITGSICFELKGGAMAFIPKKDINWKQVNRLMLRNIIASKAKSDSVDATRLDVHQRAMHLDKINQEPGI